MNTFAIPLMEFAISIAVLALNTKFALRALQTDALLSTVLLEVMNAMLVLVVTPGSASTALVLLALTTALLLIAQLDLSAQPVQLAKLPMLDFVTLQHAMPILLVPTPSTKHA